MLLMWLVGTLAEIADLLTSKPEIGWAVRLLCRLNPVSSRSLAWMSRRSCHGFLVKLSEEKFLSSGFIQLTTKGIVTDSVRCPTHGFLASTMAVTLVTAFEAL